MIDHMTFRVRNLDATRAFYVAALAPLGYRLGHEGEHEGIRMLGLEAGVEEVAQRRREDPPAVAKRLERTAQELLPPAEAPRQDRQQPVGSDGLFACRLQHSRSQAVQRHHLDTRQRAPARGDQAGGDMLPQARGRDDHQHWAAKQERVPFCLVRQGEDLPDERRLGGARPRRDQQDRLTLSGSFDGNTLPGPRNEIASHSLPPCSTGRDPRSHANLAPRSASRSRSTERWHRVSSAQ